MPTLASEHSRPVVGRTIELAHLEHRLHAALDTARQLIFVTGEPGIGKTTLIRTFLAQLPSSIQLWIGHGQCVEQYGAGEAYLPLLEALNRLSQTTGAEHLSQLLRTHAPSWLVQLPALFNALDRADQAALQGQVQGTRHERMLRELAEALSVFTTTQGLILVLEDLHWSDASTVELLAYLARRSEAARLLILGTYRPGEILAKGHPLKGVVQELSAQGQCQELRLEPLAQAAVADYLTQRFTDQPLPTALPQTVHRRTGGNPLFLVNVVDYLSQHGSVEEQTATQALEESVPENLRQFIEKQIEALDDADQHLLEVASVVGAEFCVAAVGAGLQQPLDTVEERCERLARQGQFIRADELEEWPDGTISGRYSFLHALYQDVLYTRIVAGRRVRLHRHIANAKEAAYGDRAAEVAAELAFHFERGRDISQAIQYFELAAKHALQHSAHTEAIHHLQTALTHLTTQPSGPDRDQHELRLHIALGPPLMATQGWSAAAVHTTYTRARKLCQQLGETNQLFEVLSGLRLHHLLRAEHATSQALGEEQLQLAHTAGDSTLIMEASRAIASSCFWTGEFERARIDLEQGLALYDPQQYAAHTAQYGQDPGVTSLSYMALVLWHLGYPDHAREKAHQAIDIARERQHAFTLCLALGWAARFYQCCRQPQMVAALLDEAIPLCLEHGFSLWLPTNLSGQGWVLAENGDPEAGIAQIQKSLDDYTAIGAVSAGLWFREGLVKAYLLAGQSQAGLAVLNDAFALFETMGEYHNQAELYRLKGECLLAQGSTEHEARSTEQNEAEECFQQAISIAQAQQAKSWQLRASLSLGRLWHDQGKTTQARELVEGVYRWFTEGFETPDLQDAETLLKTLGSQVERSSARVDSTPETVPTVPVGKERRQEPSQPTTHTPVPSRSQPRPEPAPAVAEQQPSHPSSPSIFRQEGEYWTFEFAEIVCRVKDSRGLRYLSYLLFHPNEEVHVLTLSSGGVTAEGEMRPVQRAPDQTDALSREFSDAGELLDPQARQAYTQRIQELQAEIEQAHDFNDIGRVERLQEELDFLSQELSQAVGLGGRARRAGSASERARSNVSKRLREAIKRIADQHPVLGDHLGQTIKTGTYCSYAPDPLLSIHWQSE